MCVLVLWVRVIGGFVVSSVNGVEGVAVIPTQVAFRVSGAVGGASIRSFDGILCACDVLNSANVRGYDGILCTCDVLRWG